MASRTRKFTTAPSPMVTSCRTTSATRRSRTVLAAVSTALGAAASLQLVTDADDFGDAIDAVGHALFLWSDRSARTVAARRDPTGNACVHPATELACGLVAA